MKKINLSTILDPGKYSSVLKESKIIFETNISISSIIVPVSILIAFSIALFEVSELSLKVFFSIVLIQSIYKLWDVFEAINILVFDTENQFILIKTRNPIKNLFIANPKIKYSEISRFSIVESNDIQLGRTRYIIVCLKKDGSSQLLTNTHSNSKSMQINVFFSRIIHSR